MNTDLPARLRAALIAADYSYDTVADLLGSDAQAALGRNETTPGLRATREGGPLATLARLWLLQTPVPLADAESALPGLIDPLCAEGILERSIAEVGARVDVRPYGTDDGSLLIASDLTPGLDGTPSRIGTSHVLGTSPASTSLAQLTIRRSVDKALDLGTGCGVQALHLTGHARHVVATDVNSRASWLTSFNAALNDVKIDVREGDFFAPVAGEEFDLVVTNPPFVISPASGERFVYRDSGLPGDRVVEDIVRVVPHFLAPGGTAQILGNWLVLHDQPWQQRLEAWVTGGDERPGCAAWAVQRELADPASYVEMWLKDSGHHPSTGGDLDDYRHRYDTWLSWFEEISAEGVGFGWINLRRTDGVASLRAEEWPYEVAQPLGSEVDDYFARTALLGELGDTRLLASRLRLRRDILQQTEGAPGAADPAIVMLRQQVGMRRARQVDTATAAWVGACDGDLRLGAILDAVADLLGTDPARTRTGALGTARELIADGYLDITG
jgi:hypothetical protein